ncbi:MAG: pumilio family protein [Monoraphidium minutum]|nr:MAG: pumilio family protein [Monoraphidium minutum]
MAGDKDKGARDKKRPPQGQERPAKKHAKDGGDGKPREAPAKPAKPLSRREVKEASLAKKLKFRRNFATIQEAVKLWEKLRPKAADKAEKEELAERIVGMFSGKILELANQHTASRVIQFCLRDGPPATRAAVASEVRGHAVELSKSMYGHYLVAKLISVAPKEDVPGLVAVFKGRVAELLRHPQGADVLTDLYDVAPQHLRNAMCAELYGREYALFDGVGGAAPLAGQVGHLRQLLEGAPPAKRKAVLQHLTKCLQPVLEKALLHPPMTHRLLRELLEAAPSSVVADAVDTLAATGGSVLKMVHTHDGAAAACMALAYGTPRDRKRLVKGMKGYVWQMAENEWGNAVVATALSVVDDTSLTAKAIVGDIKSKLEDYLDHRHARRVLLQLLAPDAPRYLPPAINEMMHPPRRTVMEAAGAGGGSDDGDEEAPGEEAARKKPRKGKGAAAADEDAAADEEAQRQSGGGEEGGDAAAGELVERVLGESKKDPTARRAELLGSGPDSLGAALARAAAARAPELLRSQWGCDVAAEAARGGAGGLLWAAQREAVEELHAAIVTAAGAGAPGGGRQQRRGEEAQQQAKKKDKKRKAAAGGGEDEEAEEGGGAAAGGGEPLLTDFFASRALRRLVLASAEAGPGGDGARAFARVLWDGALAGRCSEWVGGHGDKVLAALVACGDEKVAKAAAAELAPLVGGDAAAWATTHGGGGPPAGGGGGGGGSKDKRKAKGKGADAAAPANAAGKAAAGAGGGGGSANDQDQQQQPTKKTRRKQK